MEPEHLEPISLIIGALAAGAGDGLKELGKDAVKQGARTTGEALSSAWGRLSRLLHLRLESDPVDEARLTIYESDPTEANADALRTVLSRHQFASDDEVRAAAEEVWQLGGPAAFGEGSLAATTIQQFNDRGAVGIVGNAYGSIQAGYRPAGEDDAVNP